MKVLAISRNQLEIARGQLRKPLITVGRSPTCDIILRAPGIGPIHYLVEWIGSGEFDPLVGTWSIADVGTRRHALDPAEGMVLSARAATIGGLKFACIEDRIEAHEVIGGGILDNLASRPSRVGGELLELVQVRTDSGAVEEVLHRRVTKTRKAARLLKDVPEFKVDWQKGPAGQLFNVLLEEMPGAEIYLRGQLVTTQPAPRMIPIKPNDLLQIRWKDRDFFLRLVSEVKAPRVPRDPIGEPLLKKTALAGLLLALLLGVLIYTGHAPEPAKQEPPRIATIEIAPEPPPAPALHPTEQPVSATNQPVVKPNPAKAAKPENIPASAKKTPPAKAVAARTKTAPGAPRAGLNTPAKPADVNTVGLLGALTKSPPKGKGVQANKLLNQGFISDTVSAKDNSGITLKAPPAGAIGTGNQGSPNTASETGLSGAQTTLRGAEKYDPSSTGPIAAANGSAGLQAGSGLSEGGVGVSSGSSTGLGTGDFSVDEGGGLDRETVRRVIKSHTNEIRTCYEKALLASPELSGRVVYKWTIGAQGPVQTAELARSEVKSPELSACILEVIRAMVFPNSQNGRPTVVIYPFVFQSRR